jgi:glycerol-3-phosphate dehydrogenase
LAGRDALVLEHRRDRRTFFAIPWQDKTLIGTTDTRFFEDPDKVSVDSEDIEYLLDAARHFVPGAKLSPEQVSYSFAGLRPLVSRSKASVPEGKISRRHLVLREPAGVITLVGGKFTTFRRMSEEAVTALIQELGMKPRPSSTNNTAYFRIQAPKREFRAEPELWQSLVERYGPRAGTVFDVCQSSDVLRQPFVEGQPVRLGELLFAIKDEGVRTARDFLERRTHLAWHMKSSDLAKSQIALEPFLTPSFLADFSSSSEARRDAP